MIKRYLRRTRMYYKLRAAHFTTDEAKELSQLHRLDYRELTIMRRQRQELWQNFKTLAKRSEWGITRRRREWKGILGAWYSGNGYIERGFAWWKKFPEKSVWAWFDAVSYSLPEEYRYTKNSRRLDKTKQEPYEKIETKVMERRIVEGLKQTAKERPDLAANLLGLARHHGFKGRSLI